MAVMPAALNSHTHCARYAPPANTGSGTPRKVTQPVFFARQAATWESAMRCASLIRLRVYRRRGRRLPRSAVHAQAARLAPCLEVSVATTARPDTCSCNQGSQRAFRAPPAASDCNPLVPRCERVRMQGLPLPRHPHQHLYPSGTVLCAQRALLLPPPAHCEAMNTCWAPTPTRHCSSLFQQRCAPRSAAYLALPGSTRLLAQRRVCAAIAG